MSAAGAGALSLGLDLLEIARLERALERRPRLAERLFTDADTIHEPGDLSRAIHEAERHQAALLSYSPRQIVTGFWQQAVMPLVFSELASVYPPKQVSDPASRLAAAPFVGLSVDTDVIDIAKNGISHL